jgi:ABC-type methionine transport system permease subunit
MINIFSHLLETISYFFIIFIIDLVLGFIIGVFLFLFSGQLKWRSSSKFNKSDFLQKIISLLEFFPFVFDFLIFLCFILFFNVDNISPLWFGALIAYSNMPLFINNTYVSLKSIGETKYNFLVLLGPTKIQLIKIVLRETIYLFVSKSIRSSAFILTSILIVGFKSDIGITHSIINGGEGDKFVLLISVSIILLLYLTIYINSVMIEKITRRGKS